MSKNYLSIIVTHGNLAIGLKDVSNKFLPLEFPVYTFSNEKDSIEIIVEDITKKIEEHKPEKVAIFVDLLGGSCWHAAMKLKKISPDIAIITGVNIPLLVSFAANYNRMEWPDLLIKLEEDAKKGIRIV